MLFGRGGEGGDYEALHVVQDPPSGLRAIVVLHSTRLGPAAGGIRRRAYPGEEDALRDALHLAAGMTAKNAFAELPAGGGKTVLLDAPGLDLPAAYRALGRAIEALGGRYLAGGDVGTGEAQLAWVREATRFVNPPSNDSSAPTAQGVEAAIRGALAVRDGSDALAGRRVVVQGLGAVGGKLAASLHAQGAEVLGSDVAPQALEAARGIGIKLLAPEEVLRTPCDVLAPCALGGVLTAEAAERIPARIVCGAANNQLHDPAAGAALHRRGVTYVPDFVANAGGVIEGVLVVRLGDTPAVRRRVAEHVAATRGRVEDLLRRAAREGLPPEAVALRVVRERVG